MDRGASNIDITLKLRQALTKGISEEESRHQRRRLVRTTLGGLALFALGLAFVHSLGGPRGSWHLPVAFSIVSLMMTGFRYRQLAPKPPQEVDEKELAALATMYAACSSCGMLIGKHALGCGNCGSLRRPRAAVAAVILLAITTVLALAWIWVRSERF